MGEIIPTKVRSPGIGANLVRSLALAVCYVALVPVVAALGLIGAATYFPGPTGAVLGPALRALLPETAAVDSAKADEALAKTAAVEGRLAKLEADIAALAAKPASPGAAEQNPAVAGLGSKEVESQIGSALGPVRKESADRDKMLAAVSSLTLARAELLAGNREVAQREVTLAQKALTAPGGGSIAGAPADALDMLARAADALSRGLSSAGDYLSLVWHSLADALVATN